MNRLQAFEQTFQTVLSAFSYWPYTDAINREEEKRRFFKALESGKSYQPQLIYRPLENARLRLDIEALRPDLPADHPLAELYQASIQELLDTFDLLDHRHDPERYTSLSVKIFGKPDALLVNESLKLLDRIKDEPSEVRTISAEMARQRFKDGLTQRNFCWDVQLDPALSALIHVDSTRRLIRIRESGAFSERDMQRLFVHELDTHVLRAENGRQQDFCLFAHGFPGYMATEEGVATVMEDAHGLLNPRTRRKYALRVLAVHYALDHSFFETFSQLTQIAPSYPQRDLFDMVLRVKRGLSDTSRPGSYTKDFCYFQGFRAVQEYLHQIHSATELALLFVGHVSLSYLPQVGDLLQRGIIQPPRTLPVGGFDPLLTAFNIY
jgi:uncharacterized protein (TIGR02421 family)